MHIHFLILVQGMRIDFLLQEASRAGGRTLTVRRAVVNPGQQVDTRISTEVVDVLEGEIADAWLNRRCRLDLAVKRRVGGHGVCRLPPLATRMD